MVAALTDGSPGVRRHAVRLAEPFLNRSAEVAAGVLKLTEDGDAQVRLQVACSLGTIASGGTVIVTIMVKPNKKGQITNTATVSATGAAAGGEPATEAATDGAPIGAPHSSQ